jgi:T-complex protein 1 subunit theta
LNATTLVTRLVAAHCKGDVQAAIHLESGEVKSASEMGVFDLYGTKYWALKLAADAAITVLGIDQIIMAKPAGGPKIRQPGARDA